MKYVHEGIKAFKCKECDTEFAQKGDLKRHIESIHKGIKLFKCNICNAEYTLKGNLQKHIESFHDGKRYDCTICDKNFTQKGRNYNLSHTLIIAPEFSLLKKKPIINIGIL